MENFSRKSAESTRKSAESSFSAFQQDLDKPEQICGHFFSYGYQYVCDENNPTFIRQLVNSQSGSKRV